LKKFAEGLQRVDKGKVLETLGKLTPEQWTRHTYKDGDTYCAVGYLLHEAGISDDNLDEYVVTFDTRVEEELHAQFDAALLREYGMNRYDRGTIVDINDVAESLDDLRETVAEEL
jgi:hypothetical protein